MGKQRQQILATTADRACPGAGDHIVDRSALGCEVLKLDRRHRPARADHAAQGAFAAGPVADQQPTMPGEGLLLDGAQLLALQQQVNGARQIRPIRRRRQPPYIARLGIEREQPVALRGCNHLRGGNVCPLDQRVGLPPLGVVLDPDDAPSRRQKIRCDAGPAQIPAGRRECDMGRRSLDPLPQRETAPGGGIRRRLLPERRNRHIRQRYDFRGFQRHGVQRVLPPGGHRVDAQRQPASEPGFGLAIVGIVQANLPAHDQKGVERRLPRGEQALPGIELTGSGGRLAQRSAKAVVEFERQRTQAMLKLLGANRREPRQRSLIPGQMLPERIPGNARNPAALEGDQGGVAKLAVVDEGLLTHHLSRLLNRRHQPQRAAAIAAIDVQAAGAEHEQIVRRRTFGHQHLPLAYGLETGLCRQRMRRRALIAGEQALKGRPYQALLAQTVCGQRSAILSLSEPRPVLRDGRGFKAGSDQGNWNQASRLPGDRPWPTSSLQCDTTRIRNGPP